MPFLNFHAASVRLPGSFVEESIKEINQSQGGSIRFDGGRLKSDPEGSAVVQAVRFAKEKFTPAEAKAWLKEHDFKALQFEEASKEDSVDGEECRRFDHTPAGKVERTDDGFLIANAVVTRAGVFKYRMPDGSIRAEFRSPSEVFKADSMKTAEMLPITNDHPKEFVSPSNAKELTVGLTGQNVRQDGMNLRTPVKITTDEGIAAVDRGQKELSLGYKCRVVTCDGEFEGERYTHAQKRIRYNHLALVYAARAGHQATLRLDGADAVMVPDTGKEPKEMGGTVKLDNGIDYDCAPEVAVEVDKLRKDRAELQSKLDSGSKETGELQGKHDALEAKVKELEARDDASEIREAVKARIALEKAATPHLPKETAEKLDGMTDLEIQKAVILAGMPDAKLDEMDEPWIRGAFAVACRKPAEKRGDGQGSKVVGTAEKRGDSSEAPDSEKARQDSIDRARRRSRGEDVGEKKSA
jgi:hypothetical protein